MNEEGRLVGGTGSGAEARLGCLIPKRRPVIGQVWATGPGQEHMPDRAWE